MLTNERLPIMVSYTHIVKWLESCFTTAHLESCKNAIVSFEKVHASNEAMPQLKHDLDTLWRSRHTAIARMELDAIRFISSTISVRDDTEYVSSDEKADSILTKVSEALSVDKDLLLGDERSRSTSDARMICYMLLFNNVNYISKSQIGRIFNRHHSTIIHGLEQAKSLLETDRDFQQKYLAATSFLITQNKIQ